MVPKSEVEAVEAAANVDPVRAEFIPAIKILNFSPEATLDTVCSAQPQLRSWKVL